MSLDLNTHGKELRDSVSDVLSGKLGWIVLGYPQPNTLNVVEQGAGQLSEMLDVFEESQVLYGFARVIDPNSSLPKYLFINWQGTATPNPAKVAASQHTATIQRLCRTVHVSVNARNETDLDEKELMEKIGSASGANYGVHKEKPKSVPLPPIKPASSSYQPVNVAADKSLSERDKFWAELEKQEEQEKRSALNQKRTPPQILTEKPKLEARPTAVGSVYKPINPTAEIQALRKSSVGAATNSSPPEHNEKVGSVYKKIDPMSEIRRLRENQQGASDAAPPSSVSSVYKKINPLEEIRNMKSGGGGAARGAVSNGEGGNESSRNNTVVGSVYKKTNPMAEITQLRKMSNESNDIASIQAPSSVYQKVNPAAEIAAAKKNRETANEAAAKIRAQEQEQKERGQREEAENAMREQQQRERRAQQEREREQLERERKQREQQEREQREREQREREAKEREEERRRHEQERERAEEQARIDREEENRHWREQQQRTETEEEENRRRQAKAEEEAAERERERQREQERQEREREREREREHEEQERRRQQQQEQQEREEQEAQERELERRRREREEQEHQARMREEQARAEAEADAMRRQREAEEAAAAAATFSKSGLSARAKFDYTSKEEDEISFVEGDVITNIVQLDEGWWNGVNQEGKEGLFPSNYVDLIDDVTAQQPHHQQQAVSDPHHAHTVTAQSPAVTATPSASSTAGGGGASGQCAVALYDYEAVEEDELSFMDGEVISEIELIDEGWWIGTNPRGERGMFPSNYVEMR